MVSSSATPPRIWHPLGGRPRRRAEVIHPPSRRSSAPPGPSQPRLGPVAGTCPQGQVSGTCWASLDCKAGTAPCLGTGQTSGSEPWIAWRPRLCRSQRARQLIPPKGERCWQPGKWRVGSRLRRVTRGCGVGGGKAWLLLNGRLPAFFLLSESTRIGRLYIQD